MKSFGAMLGLILLAPIVVLAQRPGGFEIIGPGGGGAMFHPTVSPHDPHTAVLACDMTGAYITHDGGNSWRMFNLRGVVRFFVFDPKLSNVIYAGTNNLWRSKDSGDTWNLVFPAPSTIQSISMSSDHSDEKVLATPVSLEEITALAIDPAESNHLYAAGGGKHPGIFESKDAGGEWKRVFEISERASHIWISSNSEKSLLIAGEHNLIASFGSEGKLTISSTPADLIDATAANRHDGRWLIYAATRSGVFLSKDVGATWTESKLPGTGAKVRAVSTSYRHPDIAYASYSGLILDGTEWHGVARTQNAGKTWQLVWKESAAAARNVSDAWITDRFGTDWGENPLNLGVADKDPYLVYGTDFGRTLISNDGGLHWKASYSRRASKGDWASTGLDVTTSYGIHFDPFDSERLFITYTDISLFRSETGGKSWISSSTGIPKNWLNTAYWMVFDPEVKGRAWTVNSSTHDLPRPKMFRHTSTDTYQGGVCRSDDGGKTWIPASVGMLPTAPTDIVLDPASPKDHRTLYVAAFGRGVYKSVDGGNSWTLKNTGIQQPEPMAWRIALALDHSLYLIIARRSEDGSIGNTGDGALYHSIDGAQTWQPLALPDGVNAPNGIAIDPTNPRRLYLAAWARAVGLHGEGGGVYRSDDAGQHWRSSLDRDQHVYDVTVDPRLPGTLYAAGFESSAWVSRDFGERWERISGFNFKWGHRVVLDPEDEKRIYITTFGGGVWHGAVDTHPAILDIATPEMEPPI